VSRRVSVVALHLFHRTLQENARGDVRALEKNVCGAQAHGAADTTGAAMHERETKTMGAGGDAK